MISAKISAPRAISATNSLSHFLHFTNLRPSILPKTFLNPSTTVYPKPQPLHLHKSPFTTKSINNEELSAKSASLNANTNSPTIFDKIVSKEIPSSIVYEDDNVLAFRDINPQAPVHVVVIPKLRDGLTQLSKAEERHCEILGKLMYVAKIVAEKEGIDKDGFRVVVNDGVEGCQSVYHLHLHVLGGRQMKWPPG